MAALHSIVFPRFGVQWMDSLLCALDPSVRGDYIAEFFSVSCPFPIGTIADGEREIC
jgi:hypothetical protein